MAIWTSSHGGKIIRRPARCYSTGPWQTHGTITDPKEIAGLLGSSDDYRGSIVTRCALQLAPLVFVRPGELRHAEWVEFDFDAAEWRIPPENRVVDAAERELAQSGRHYQRGGLIVTVVTDPGTRETRVENISQPALVRALSSVATWEFVFRSN